MVKPKIHKIDNRAELQSLPGENLFQVQKILYSVAKVLRRQEIFIEGCYHPEHQISICTHITDHLYWPTIERSIHRNVVAVVCVDLRGTVLSLEHEIRVTHKTTPVFFRSIGCSCAQEVRGTVPAGLFFCALKSCSDLALKAASLFRLVYQEAVELTAYLCK